MKSWPVPLAAVMVVLFLAPATARAFYGEGGYCAQSYYYGKGTYYSQGSYYAEGSYCWIPSGSGC